MTLYLVTNSYTGEFVSLTTNADGYIDNDDYIVDEFDTNKLAEDGSLIIQG